MQNSKRNEKFNRIESSIDEIDLKELFLYFKDHRWFILTVTSIVFMLGIIMALRVPASYNSSALIQIEGQSSSSNMQQLLGSMGFELASKEQASVVDIESALINSRYILTPVIEKLGLNIVVSPHYYPIIGSFISHSPDKELSKPFFGLSKYAWGGEKIQLKKFEVDNFYESKRFVIRADGNDHYSLLFKGDLILHGVVGKLAETQNALMPHVKMLISELKANQGTQFYIVRNPTENSLNTLSQGLSIVDIGVKDKSRTGVLEISLQGADPHTLPVILNTVVDYTIQKNIEKKSAEASNLLLFLNKQLPIVKNNLDIAETNLNNYRAQSGSINMSEEAKILLTQLASVEQAIEESRLKKVEILQDLTPEHPFVITLVQKIEQLEKEASDLKNRIKLLPKADQKAVSLEREVKVKEQMYALLLNKIQESQVLQAGMLSDVRILDKATIPLHPLPVHRSFILLVSIMAGFMIAIFILFLRKLSQKGLGDPAMVEEQLGITAFAIIPYSKQQSDIQRNIQLNSKKVSILSYNNPKDISVEAIRSLRTVLQFSLMTAKNNVIGILGASPNIGKSFVSVNLAQVLVDSGKRVLLIDADMRKGKICQYFGLQPAPGLSELLSNKSQIENVTNNINDSFDFIATGKYPVNPSELLLNNKLQNELEKLSALYDLIVIDTAPVLAVTDGIIIAKLAATNLMVIGAESDNIKELTLATNRIKKNGIEIDGLVFNSKNRSKKSSGQYNYYYAYEEET